MSSLIIDHSIYKIICFSTSHYFTLIPSIYLRRQRLHFLSLFILRNENKTTTYIYSKSQWDCSLMTEKNNGTKRILLTNSIQSTSTTNIRIRWMHLWQRDVLHCQIDWTLITNVRPFGNTLRIIIWSSRIYGLKHFTAATHLIFDMWAEI